MEKTEQMTRRELIYRILQMGGLAGASALLAGCNIGNRKAPVMKPAASSGPAPVNSVAAAPAVTNAVTSTAGNAPAVATGNLNQFGMNVWTLSDWDGSFAFVDAMKHARPWFKNGATSTPAPTDENGWPTSDAATVVYSGMPEHINGTYKLIFTGQGEIGFVFYQSGTITNQVYDASTNTTTADVNFAVPPQKVATGGASVGISITNSQRTPSSPIGSGFTNMRLYRPGYPTNGSVVFTDYYVKAMQIGSVIRTMDWTATNGNTIVNWNDRNTPLTFAKPYPSYISGTTKMGGSIVPGAQPYVALEHHIQLANATGRDLWLNIPVVASDDFVTKMAQAILYGTNGTDPYTSPQSNPAYPPLNPGLNVYIEYANETWNFSAGFWCYHVIMALINTLPASHPIYSVVPQTNVYYTGFRYTAYRISQISDLFRSVFGDSAMMTRVRPVLMGQKGTANHGTMDWLDAYGATLNPPREVKSYIYGAGGSGYYGVNVMASTPDTYFTPGNYPDTATTAAFPLDAMAAKNYGLQRIAYEGGDGVDNIPTANKLAINADPRMETMTIDMHNLWSADGGDLLVYYTMTGAADWEFTPDISNLDTPKCNALYSLSGKPRAAVTLGQVLPGEMLVGTLPNVADSNGFSGYTLNRSYGKVIGGIRPGQWVAFPGNSTKAFNANLSVNAIALADSVLTLWINGTQTGNVSLSENSNLVWSAATSALIPQGLVMVRLQLVSGNIIVRSINVQAT